MKKILFLFTLIITQLINAQQHTFTSFSPSFAGTGDIVTLRGTNFTGVTGVTFGGTSASSFTIENATTIRAVVAGGTSGSIVVTKTGVGTPNRSLTGFNYSALPTVTGIVTNFNGVWSTNTTTNNSTKPDSTHALLAFTYKNEVYSTGLNDGLLSGSFNVGDFRGLPVTLVGNTDANGGHPQYIITSPKLDGSLGTAISTHVNIKDLTIQSVLVDGPSNKGLDLSTGYTNLTTGSTSNYTVQFIDSTKINDNEPDILVTQIAEPTGTTTDTYTFLDASGNVVGNSLSVSLDLVSKLGTYKLDLFSVPLGISFSTAKPNGSFATTERDIRFVGFRLSDFGINNTNFNNIEKLRIVASGKSDVAFVAYNANAIYSPPVITDISPSTAYCASTDELEFKMNVVAPGETLAYQWEKSVDGGTIWDTIVGETSISLIVDDSELEIGDKYRLRVTVVTSGRVTYGPEVTVDGDCPLPVELLSFSYDCDKFIWETASENNSDYFRLESSDNGEDWDLEVVIPSAGNSTELLTYEYQIERLTKNYYRLKQVDINGEFKEYDPISPNCDSDLIIAKPNPSNSEFSILITSDNEYFENLIIYDMVGNILLRKTLKIKEGVNVFLFDENLKSGLYLIKTNNTIIKHLIK